MKYHEWRHQFISFGVSWDTNENFVRFRSVGWRLPEQRARSHQIPGWQPCPVSCATPFRGRLFEGKGISQFRNFEIHFFISRVIQPTASWTEDMCSLQRILYTASSFYNMNQTKIFPEKLHWANVYSKWFKCCSCQIDEIEYCTELQTSVLNFTGWCWIWSCLSNYENLPANKFDKQWFFCATAMLDIVMFHPTQAIKRPNSTQLRDGNAYLLSLRAVPRNTCSYRIFNVPNVRAQSVSCWQWRATRTGRHRQCYMCYIWGSYQFHSVNDTFFLKISMSSQI